MRRYPIGRAALVAAVLLTSLAARAQDQRPAEPAAPPAPAPSTAQAGADEIDWRDFSPAVIRRALAEDRLILLVLEQPWSALCAKARAEVWNNPDVVRAVKAAYVPVRVRADLRPDLLARYPAENWPAVSVLLWDGTPLWVQPKEDAEPVRVSRGFLPAAEMARLLVSSAGYYRTDRDKALALAGKRAKEMDKSVVPEKDQVDATAVWSVALKLRQSFDPERRYFGGPPRLPRFEMIDMMLRLAGETEDPWRPIGLAALDTLGAKLVDPADGGLRRMALGLDWEDVQPEKLLDRNARYADALTLAWRLTGSKSYRERLQKSTQFLVEKLGRPDGLFRVALDGALADDGVVPTAPNAIAAGALIRAGAALDDAALVQRGLKAATVLREQRYRAGRLMARTEADGQAGRSGYLEDQAASAQLFLSAYEATGEREWLEAARNVVTAAVANLRGKDTAALADALVTPDAPTPLKRPLYPLSGNMDVVRALVRLFYLTDERPYRNTALAILQAFGKSYERWPLHTPYFPLAAYEYFMPPITVAVIGGPSSEAGTALRRAAMGAMYPFTIVRTFDPATEADVIEASLHLGSDVTPRIKAFHAGLSSAEVPQADAVRGALASLRERKVFEDKKKADDLKKNPLKGSSPGTAGAGDGSAKKPAAAAPKKPAAKPAAKPPAAKAPAAKAPAPGAKP